MENEFLESLPSPETRKSYKRGLDKFREYYGKDLAEFLKEEDPSKIIERFYVWLKAKYSQNSSKNYTNSIIQYAKYNNIPIKIRRALKVYKSEMSTKDYILTVDDARKMYNTGDFDDKRMVKIWLKGLRIEDAVDLKTPQITETPVESLVMTKKEGIIAHIFYDSEDQKLVDSRRTYIFHDKSNGHIVAKQLLRRLQSLAIKAGIDFNGKTFGWHIGRKLVLRTCAELGITSWNAMMMVGKAIDKSIETYINHLKLKEDYLKVFSVLRMELNNGNGRVTKVEEALAALEKENTVLKTRLDGLQKTVQQMEKIVKQAWKNL